MPLVESMLAITHTAMAALSAEPDPLANTWDQTRETANQGRQWLKTHPCPDQSQGDQFGRVIEQCEHLAVAIFQSINVSTTVSFDDLATQIRLLGTGAIEFLEQVDPR